MDALKNVLTRFSANGVTLKLKKCQFGVSKIEYVGHIVTGGQGVPMNPKKVDALLAKEAPHVGQRWPHCWGQQDAIPSLSRIMPW